MSEPASPRPGDRRRHDRRAAARGSDHAGGPAAQRLYDRRASDRGVATDGLSFFAEPQAAAAAAGLGRDLTDMARSGPTTFQRIYLAFLGARAALGVILVVMLAVGGFFGTRPSAVIASFNIAYATLVLSMWLLPRFRGAPASPNAPSHLSLGQWLATIGVDSLCFLTLHVLAPASSLNYSAMLVLPVLMASVLTPRLMGLGTCAAVTLVLLIHAVLEALAGGDAPTLLTQAGLAGSGLFMISVVAGEVAARLAREELAARGSLELARQQVQLNRLVIEEMQDGVLIVDLRGGVRAANPAARRLLAPSGMCRPAPFRLDALDAWSQLLGAVDRAFAESAWPDEGRDVVLSFDAAIVRTVRVRVRFARRGELRSGEDYCVLLLEDLRNMQARLRQEKLAAMGRVSAGIAHEIRNPLATISQANALMAEDATTEQQRQLTHMVSENVARLKRLVDDVMEVAPGRSSDAVAIDLTALVGSACRDWAAAVRVVVAPDGPVLLDLPDEPLGALFDPEHLRRVLINLLDNAIRHASGAPGSVVLRLFSPDDQRAVISVANDGEAIGPDVEPFMFEPFFSNRSRGTGLGLYICRELCERYGASIDYRARPSNEPNRNVFSVVMKRAVVPAGA